MAALNLIQAASMLLFDNCVVYSIFQKVSYIYLWAKHPNFLPDVQTLSAGTKEYGMPLLYSLSSMRNNIKHIKLESPSVTAYIKADFRAR